MRDPAPDKPDKSVAAELLKASSHSTRLAILQEVAAGPKCVTDMEEILPARQANISQHLAVLRHAQLVDYAQDGALRCYYLCRPKLVEDMLSLVARNDRVVKQTPAEIQADVTVHGITLILSDGERSGSAEQAWALGASREKCAKVSATSCCGTCQQV